MAFVTEPAVKTAVRNALIEVAIADEAMTQAEFTSVSSVYTWLTGETLNLVQFRTDAERLHQESGDPSRHLTPFLSRLPSDVRTAILRGCITVASCDNELDGRELQKLERIAGSLGYNRDGWMSLLGETIQAQKDGGAQRAAAPPAAPPPAAPPHGAGGAATSPISGRATAIGCAALAAPLVTLFIMTANEWPAVGWFSWLSIVVVGLLSASTVFSAKPQAKSKSARVLQLISGLAVLILLTAALVRTADQYSAYLVFGALLAAVGAMAVVEAHSSLHAKPGARKRAAIAFAVALVLLVAVTPLVSPHYRRYEEQQAWNSVQGSYSKGAIAAYEAAVEPRYRRAELANAKVTAEANELEAEAKNVSVQRNARRLWEIVQTTRQRNDPHFAAAATAARAGLETCFKEAHANLATTRAKSDPRLALAFEKVLDQLQASNDGTVYVAFHTTSEFDPAESARLGNVSGKTETIHLPGDEVSEKATAFRRGSFLAALDKAFSAVFKNGLLLFTPLKDGETRARKVVFDIGATSRKTNDVFVHTTTTNSQVTSTEQLQGLKMDWQFKLFDASGAMLYSDAATTNPATSAHFKPGDSAYRVMFNSAYDNYARRLIEKFGLMPPAEITNF